MPKGISPLIASVLLIAFTVALGTVVMGWLSSTTGTTTKTIGTKVATAIDCSDAGIRIEHAYISSSDNGVIVVLNTGFKNFTNVTGNIYVGDEGEYCESVYGLSPLVAGASGRIQLDMCPYFDDETDVSFAIVTTECGGISNKKNYDPDYFDVYPGGE